MRSKPIHLEERIAKRRIEFLPSLAGITYNSGLDIDSQRCSMTLSQIEFKVQHDCPFNNLSKRFPSATMALWCNREREVLEVRSDDATSLNRIDEELKHMKSIVRKIFSRKTGRIAVTMKCLCTLNNSIVRHIDQHNCLQIPPTVYSGGWEFYRMVSFRHRDVKELFGSLDRKARLEIISSRQLYNGEIHDSLCVSLSDLFSRLTEKQIKAFLGAYDSGYYRIPKKITAAELARKIHLSRTTFEEHLRKAENKVLSAIVPYLQLYSA